MAAKNRYDALPVRNLGQLLRRSVESRDRPSDHPPHPHTGLRLHLIFNSHCRSIEITILTKISEIFEAKTIQVWENAKNTFVQKHIDSLDRFYKMKQIWNRGARVGDLESKMCQIFWTDVCVSFRSYSYSLYILVLRRPTRAFENRP